MKKRKIEGPYWKERYDFNSEYQIYLNLYGNLKKNDIKKLDVDKRFGCYKSWREYVRSLYYYQNDVEQLFEFSKYLNYKKREVNSTNKWTYSYGAPFILALAVAIFFEPLLEDIVKLQQSVVLSNWCNKICIYLLFFLLIVILFSILLFPMLKILKDAERSKAFYKDYKKIIDEIIKEKRKSKKKK